MPSKEEVVQFMTDTVNNLNRQVGLQQGIDPNEIERAILEHQNQLIYVNSMLYDALLQNQVIVSG